MTQNTPWHDQDDFWKSMAPFLFTDEHWAKASAQVEQVLVLLGVMPGASVLDLCCGPGRHAFELARRGLRVTGVDRTAAYLDYARKQAEAEGAAIEFVLEDMRSFCRPEAFDGAVNLYTSFGYFDSPADDRRVVLNVFRSLRHEASFVIEMMGKEVLAGIFRERDWREQDGVILLEERRISDNWNRMENRWTLIDGDSRKEFTVSHRLYSAAELTSLVLECGFASVDVYGDLSGSPYDHTAERLVVVAHKA
jgi:SAM-dependent methyltransferase